MSKFNEIVEKARQMPLLSNSSMRLMEIISEPNHNMQDIAKIVETDPALTVKILEMANSASYALRQPANTVAEALPYLGEKLITGLAMSQCAPQVFNRPMLGYESQRGELWAHGLRTAIAANEIAKVIKLKVWPGVAYTAGILHDIGKSVLSKFLTGMSPEMIKKLEKNEVDDYLAAEEAMVGANHCSIGGELAKHWKLTPPLQAAIAHHHQPADAEEEHRPLVYVVHLADMMAMLGGTGTGSDTLGYNLDHRYAAFLEIDSDTFDKIMMDILEEFEKITQALNQIA